MTEKPKRDEELEDLKTRVAHLEALVAGLRQTVEDLNSFARNVEQARRRKLYPPGPEVQPDAPKPSRRRSLEDPMEFPPGPTID